MQVVLLGDLIAAGLEVKGCSYADILETKLCTLHHDTKVFSLAETAKQLSASIAQIVEIVAFQPDYIIIAHGTTEGVVRPTSEALRFVPARWRQIGWLDPRPYFSRRLWKSIYHRAESAIRWRIKVYLITKYGGSTLTSVETFEQILVRAVDKLLRETSATIIVVTHNGIDERFYPGSLASLNLYKDAIIQSAVQSRSPRVKVCNLTTSLNQWSDSFEDHFHPNANGHRIIADVIFLLMQKAHSEPTAASDND